MLSHFSPQNQCSTFFHQKINHSLLMDLLEKLPVYYSVFWGNYATKKEELGYEIKVVTFENWLRRQAEC